LWLVVVVVGGSLGDLIAAIGSHCAWVVETAWLDCQPPGCGHRWWLANGGGGGDAISIYTDNRITV